MPDLTGNKNSRAFGFVPTNRTISLETVSPRVFLLAKRPLDPRWSRIFVIPLQFGPELNRPYLSFEGKLVIHLACENLYQPLNRELGKALLTHDSSVRVTSSARLLQAVEPDFSSIQSHETRAWRLASKGWISL